MRSPTRRVIDRAAEKIAAGIDPVVAVIQSIDEISISPGAKARAERIAIAFFARIERGGI